MRIENLDEVERPDFVRVYGGAAEADLAKIPLVILEAEFNSAITTRLSRGASLAGRDLGLTEILLHRVAGALELPILLAHMARSQNWYGAASPLIVVTGCVIRGETDHYTHVCQQAVGGVQRVAMDHGLPVGNAILTVENLQQALDRCGDGPDNKGYEAAHAAASLWIHLKASSLHPISIG